MIAALADGNWVNKRRMRAVAAMSLSITLLILAFMMVTANGTVDAYGRPLGTDFSNVWTAGRMTLDGHAAQVWDWSHHRAVQQAVHQRADVPFYPWPYPPPFLLVAVVLAQMPYVAALLVWQSGTLAMALAALRAILPQRDATLLAFGAPVVFVCLGHGQNAFLTAALLCGGLMLLDTRPWLAGLMLGCMIYKPQFGLVLPVLMLAGQHMRAIGGAVFSAALLTGVTFLFWGWPVWHAFLDSLPMTQSIILEQGSTGWEKIQSPFAAVRAWHGPVAAAWGVQLLATLGAVGATLFVARGVAAPVRNAAAVAAALLSTPYVLDYDLVPLSLAIAFLVVDGRARGFLSYEKSVLALVWLVPLVARATMQWTGIPIGLLSIVAMLALCVRRAIVIDRRSLPYFSFSAVQKLWLGIGANRA